MPTGTASRSATPPAPGRTPPEPLPPVQTKGQSSSARRAVCPGLFLLPIFPPLALLPARCTGSPAGSVRISDGPARSMTTPAPRRRSRSPRPPAPPARSRPTPTATPAPHRRPRSLQAAQPAHPARPHSSQQPTASTYRHRTPPALPPTCRSRSPRQQPKTTHRSPPPEGSDSLPDRHMAFAV